MQKNLGSAERAIRLLLAIALATVLVQRSGFGWLEVLLGLAIVFLVANTLSGRCYLWRWLNLDSTGEEITCGRRGQGEVSSD